jgi:MFS family permease
MFFCKGAALGAAAVWPIFVYLLSQQYIVMGAAATVAGIGAGILAFLTGVAADKIGRRRILVIGSLLGFAAWLAATQVADINGLFIAAAAISASALAVEIPTFAATCERAKKQPISEFMVFREFGLLAGRLFTLVPLVAVLDFRIAFLLAGVMSLGFLFFKISER